MKRCLAISMAMLCISLSCAEGRAERGLPRRSLPELLTAKRIYVGRTVESPGGGASFVLDRQLKGKRIEGVLHPLVADSPKGKFMFRPPGLSWYSPRVDVGRLTIWFVHGDHHRPYSVEPGEFADDYQRLLRGEKPSFQYRLLQNRDPDMHRDALEQLFADRDKDAIESLHRVIDEGYAPLASAAFSALRRTGTLDLDRYRGKWHGHGIQDILGRSLMFADRDRFLEKELKPALAEEKDAKQIVRLLRLLSGYTMQSSLPILRNYVDHESPEVREQSISRLQGLAIPVASGLDKDDSKEALAALRTLIESRLDVEKDETVRRRLSSALESMANDRGQRSVVREPLPPYSDAKERKFLLSVLISGNFGCGKKTAGRELIEYYFDGFKQMEVRLEAVEYNSRGLMDGIGYMRDSRSFEFLRKFIATHNVGHSCFPAAIRALGRQQHEDSFAELKKFVESEKGQYFKDYPSAYIFDALADLEDERALELLRQLEPSTDRGREKPGYVRALARYGDRAALDKLIASLNKQPANPRWSRSVGKPIPGLKHIDEPRVNEALKEYVQANWPRKRGPGLWASSGANAAASMENFAGSARRTNALGEIARRDPKWLAEFALEQMASDKLASRQLAAAVFRQLTGHILGFYAEAFASGRKEPLERLQAWWEENRENTREQWLLAHFAEKGFAMKQLHERRSLPTLVAALESDRFTSFLAAEQISIITEKYFCRFPQHTSVRDQEKMTIRVTGWLRARGYLN